MKRREKQKKGSKDQIVYLGQQRKKERKRQRSEETGISKNKTKKDEKLNGLIK